MPDPSGFPPVVIVDIQDENDPQYGAYRELTPRFSRPVDQVWAELFRMACEQSPAIDWRGADFARHLPEDVAAASDAIRVATVAANAAFVAHLREKVPVDRASDIVEVEQINAASYSAADGPFMLPFGPPRGTYM